jgi:chromosome segregation ATPase
MSNNPKVTTSQVITRSTSNSSTKTSNSPTTITKPPSLEAIQQSIFEFQQTSMAQFKSLHQSQNAKFAELKDSINLLTSQINDLKTENTTLRTNLSDLNKRIIDLEAIAHVNSNMDQLPSLLQELSERERCSCNVIVYGIPESSSALPIDRISNDAILLSEAFQPYLIPLPTNLKSIRLGKPTDRGPRALKVFLSSKETALKLISDFNAVKRSRPVDNVIQPISITRDRTRREREDIRRTYAELDSRKKNGETNIVIKYNNGLPSIASTSRSSFASRQLSHNSQSTHSKN